MKKSLLSITLVAIFSLFTFAQKVIKSKINNANDKANITVVHNFKPINFIVSASNNGVKGLLYNNGDFVTHPGQGPGGSDFSFLDVNLGLESYGFGHSISSGYSVAEDFSVAPGGWTIDSMVFYCYQTGSGTTSTINDYRVQIWSGKPGEPGSSVIWGNLTTNVLSRTSFSNCYRGNNLSNTDRPIMRNVVATNGLTLQPGVYWLQWQAGGTGSSGPWANPVAIQNIAVTGNAIQYDGTTWSDLYNGVAPQGFPFEIYGTGTPTCIHPILPSVNNITDTSAVVSWSSITGNNSWVIEYGTHGFNPGTGNIINTTTNVDTLISLTPGTAYDVYIYSDCGNGILSAPATTMFSTLSCNPSNQCNYQLEFLDSYGDGWNGASISVIFNGIAVNTYTLQDGNSGIENMPLCPGDSISLQFNGGNYNDECGLYVHDPFGNIIYSFEPGNNPTPGSIFFSFLSNCNPPSCLTPTALTVNNITTNSAELIWTAGGSETAWNIEYGPAGFTHGNGTLINVTNNPYTLTGLSQGTVYDVYIQADCGNGDLSYWTNNPVQFTTLCDPVSIYPYTESFESSVFPSDCWTKANPDNGTGWTTIAYNTSPLPGWQGGSLPPLTNGGNYAIYCTWNTGGTSSNDQWLISPLFNNIPTNAQLSFYMFWFGHYAEYVDVKLSTTNNSISSFINTLLTIDTTQLIHNDWKLFTIDLSNYTGQNIYIAFNEHVTDNFNEGAFIAVDLVTIQSGSIVNDNILNNVFVYPNPASTNLYIANSTINQIELYDISGQKIAEYFNTQQINVSNLSNGMYLIKVITPDKVITQKINIKR